MNIWSVFVTRINFLPSSLTSSSPRFSFSWFLPACRGQPLPWRKRERERGESNKTECLETTDLNDGGCPNNSPCLFYDTCCPSLSFSFGLSEVSTVSELRRAFVALDLFYFDSSSVHSRIYCGSGWGDHCPGPATAWGLTSCKCKCLSFLLLFLSLLQCIHFWEEDGGGGGVELFYFSPSYCLLYLRF